MTRTTLQFPFIFSCLFFIFNGFISVSAQPDFSEFPWLNEVVDIEDCCQFQKITAYQSGIFNFIYIEKDANCTDEGGTLYFEDGTFYCADATGLDCRTAYSLTEGQARILWDCKAQLQEVDEIYITCVGESLFLPATQTFPIPPQGPSGPNGELPPTPCQPILSDIKISPSEGATMEDLTGFTIFPTENGIYEVTSRGFCGGPGASNSDEITIRYQVIIDQECEEVSCENVLDQEWIAPFLSEKCTGKIYLVEYNGQEAIYRTSLCGCVDDADILFSCSGEVICTIGGFTDPNAEGICDETIRAQLIDDNAIWKPECDCPCPVDNNPVCGVDGVTYESTCAAFCAGVEVLENFPCEEKMCLPLANLNINENFCNSCFSEVAIYSYEGADYLVTREDNPICSDGITTVTNCDSTVVFCYEGGIAGFDQCGAFFKGAVLVETVWSRANDCDTKPVSVAESCTDLAGVDFGLCLAVMGVGVVDGKCRTISGCLNFEIDGVDYSKAIFPTVEICEQTCIENSGSDENPDIFKTYPWLADIVDPNDCASTFIEVYDLETFSYVHIVTKESSALYYEDGTFYCMDLPNYDCRALYGLTKDQITTTFTCGGPSGPSSPISGGRFVGENNSATLTPTLKAFPNPTNGLIQVRLPNRASTGATLRVFDMYGRVVKELTVKSTAVPVDLTSEDAGIYMVEWQSGGAREMIRVIKQQ